MGEEGLAERALRMLAGGVNSPIRSRMPVGFFAARGEGPYLYDTKGKRYLDYCLGYGPLILGHAHPAVADAICSQAVRGTLFGCTSDREVAYAEEVLRHLPSHLGMVRCVNSGTEATMAAIRLARGITGREDIVAFDGSYHGAHDQLLARRAPGEATSPSSRGVCPAAVSTTHLATFNDIEKTADLVRRTRAAAVIAEPVMGNMGCILPEDGFLSELRAVCTEEGALLILDEVITGFRLAPGGAQEHFGVAADIATYGKVAGGGLPIGLVAGSREVMEHLSPTGPVYNAGTFNGNPLSMAAGCAALAELRTNDALARIATHTQGACVCRVRYPSPRCGRLFLPACSRCTSARLAFIMPRMPGLQMGRDTFPSSRRSFPKAFFCRPRCMRATFCRPSMMRWISNRPSRLWSVRSCEVWDQEKYAGARPDQRGCRCGRRRLRQWHRDSADSDRRRPVSRPIW